jgi:hypothetical protein
MAGQQQGQKFTQSYQQQRGGWNLFEQPFCSCAPGDVTTLLHSNAHLCVAVCSAANLHRQRS